MAGFSAESEHDSLLRCLVAITQVAGQASNQCRSSGKLETRGRFWCLIERQRAGPWRRALSDGEHRTAETRSRRTREKRRYRLSFRLGKFREREKSSTGISGLIKEFASDGFGEERRMLTEIRRISHQESRRNSVRMRNKVRTNETRLTMPQR
jgi:hypothetical protein